MIASKQPNLNIVFTIRAKRGETRENWHWIIMSKKFSIILLVKIIKNFFKIFIWNKIFKEIFNIKNSISKVKK